MQQPTFVSFAETYAPSLAWVAASLEPFDELIYSQSAGPQGHDKPGDPEYLYLLIRICGQMTGYQITSESIAVIVDGEVIGHTTLKMLWLLLRSQSPAAAAYLADGDSL